MIYILYITVFIIVGMVLALVFRDNEEKAQFSIVAITILWAFVMGPWAIAALIELIIGYAIAKEYEFLFLAIGDLIVKAFVFILITGILIAIVTSIYHSHNESTTMSYVSPEQQCKNNENSWEYNQVNSNWECKKLYSLSVQTTPANTRIRIMNIKPKYYDGIRLPQGRYDIRIDKQGFYTKNFYIELVDDSVYKSTLTRKIY